MVLYSLQDYAVAVARGSGQAIPFAALVVDSGVESFAVPLQPWAALSSFFGHLGPVLVGIPLSLLGSTMSVCGLLLQKASLQNASSKEEVDADGNRPWVPSWLDRQFLTGLLLYGVGGFLAWIALGIAPNTVLACLNSWSIVVGPIMASTWFGERVSRVAAASALMLVVGCTWVACLGPRSYRLVTVDEINFLFAQIPFTICCVTCGTVLAAALLNYLWWRTCTPWSPVIVSLVSTAAAIFATYSVLFAKCTSMILQAALVKDDFAFGYQFYLWLAGTCLCGPLGLYFLCEALRHGSASVVIPVYQSLGTVFQLVVGGILFREYADFGLAKHFAFWPGVLLVIVSVVVLTQSEAHASGAGGQADLLGHGAGAAGADPADKRRSSASGRRGAGAAPEASEDALVLA